MKTIFFATLLAFIILGTATAAGEIAYILASGLGAIAVPLSIFIGSFVGIVLGILATRHE